MVAPIGFSANFLWTAASARHLLIGGKQSDDMFSASKDARGEWCSQGGYKLTRDRMRVVVGVDETLGKPFWTTKNECIAGSVCCGCWRSLWTKFCGVMEEKQRDPHFDILCSKILVFGNSAMSKCHTKLSAVLS